MNVTKFRRVALPVALLAFALPAAAQTMPTLTIDDASATVISGSRSGRTTIATSPTSHTSPAPRSTQ